MNNQFKPGDPALVIGAFFTPESIGTVVTLKELVTVKAHPWGGWYETSEPDALRGWIIEPNEFTEAGDGYLEFHLMPLRGEFEPDQAKSREVPA